MYYLRNENDDVIEEEITVDGVKKQIKMFANETIYNIEADQIELKVNTHLIAKEHSTKIITKEMEAHFTKYKLVALSENLRYRVVKPEVSKKVIIVLGEMSLQGHNANLQYIYTPFNKFIENAFINDATVISLVDTKNAVGDIYRVGKDELAKLRTLIKQVLKENELSYQDLFFVGSSIGATAAILLGSDYEGATIVSSMPVMKVNQFCVDNLSRKALYFINDNYQQDICSSINPGNTYYLYCGSYDLTAHHNLCTDMLLTKAYTNVNFNIVNDWHTATKKFKNQILYDVDKSINEYKQTNIDINSYTIENEGNQLIIAVGTNIVQTPGMCATVVISCGDSQIKFKADWRIESNEYYVDGNINLYEVLDRDQLKGSVSLQLVIVDYDSKQIYSSELVTKALSGRYEQQLFKTNFGQIIPTHYYCNHNLLSVECEYQDVRDTVLVRILVGDELYYPMEVKRIGEKLILSLNERRPLLIPDESLKIMLQIVWEDYSEDKLELLINAKKNVK